MVYDPEKYQKYRESYAAAHKRYYKKNKERLLQKQKEYDDTHREAINERHKKYYGGKLKSRIALDQ